MNKVKIIVDGLKDILASKTKFRRFVILLVVCIFTAVSVGGVYILLKGIFE